MIQLPKHLIYPEDYDREQEKISNVLSCDCTGGRQKM